MNWRVITHLGLPSSPSLGVLTPKLRPPCAKWAWVSLFFLCLKKKKSFDHRGLKLVQLERACANASKFTHAWSDVQIRTRCVLFSIENGNFKKCQILSKTAHNVEMRHFRSVKMAPHKRTHVISPRPRACVVLMQSYEAACAGFCRIFKN